MTTKFVWLRFISRRLLALSVILIVISFAAFSLLYLAPGKAADILIGPDQPHTKALVAAINHKYHLDQPFLTQYWIWAKQALHFHFGSSITTGLPVAGQIKARLPISLFLGVYAFILTTVVGVGLGIVSALKRGTAVDRAVVAGAMVGASTPVYVGGIALLYVFAVLLHWFPAFGQGGGFWDELWHLTLPAIALAIHSSAALVKHTRAAIISVLEQDYVAFAKARGLSSVQVLFGYTLRNGVVPVLTIGGAIFAFLIVGAVFAETTFSIPGIGNLLVQAADSKDLPTLQGIGMVTAAIIVLANLVVDLGYAAVDPRIRAGWQGDE